MFAHGGAGFEDVFNESELCSWSVISFDVFADEVVGDVEEVYPVEGDGFEL